jgi:transcription termination factor NusB
MNGLLSSASPWQNDSNLNSTVKKRTPSLSIPRNNKTTNTTKKNIKPHSTLDNIYDIDNEETIFSEKENFQNGSSSDEQPQKQNTIESMPAIDTTIQRFLKTPWKIETLDNTVAAILRAGTYELLFNAKVESKIITSEYTNLTHAFFDGPEIGFVNAILDKISHNL